MENKIDELININHVLMESFMINAQINMLDVSFSLEAEKINIQIVILDGTNLPKETLGKEINDKLSNYEIDMIDLSISKEKFNQNRGEWIPRYYKWFPNLLFSKAEIL